jgi:subtilisin family serine protease
MRPSAYSLTKFICVMLLLFAAFAAPAAADFPGGSEGVNIDLIPNEVIVEFFDDSGSLSLADMAAFGKLAEMGRLTHRPATRYLIMSGDEPFDLIPKLEALPGVKGAYPNYRRYSMIVPNDSLYNLQKPYLDLLNMEDVWDVETGNGQVVVAVIDTGVDPDHPDLKQNLIPGGNVVGDGAEAPDYILDDSGHGTAVAGVIGAVGNNGKGVAGIAWNVKIMPIRACWGENLTCSIWDEIEAIDMAREAEVDLINMSIGGQGTMTLEEKAATDAWNAGIAMFAAAGNKGQYLKATGTASDRQTLYYPASLPEVIGVGAIDVNLERAEFSNYGEVVSEIYAPGVGIVSTIPQYTCFLFPEHGIPYGKIDGTSFSCPMVTGVAVLLLSHYPELGPADIMQRLFSTAIPLGNIDEDQNGVDDYFGHGLVNPLGALNPPDNVSSDYFDVGISGSPIFEDEVYVFVKVKKPIFGGPLVTYIIDAVDETGQVTMSPVGNDGYYFGSFTTDYNGQARVLVTGMVGGEPLPPLTLLYIIKDL